MDTIAPSRRPAAADPILVHRSVVVSALVGAALIHGSVAGEHFAEWPPAGAFFLTLQLVELLLALLAAFAWDRLIASFVVTTGVVTVLVWLVSRTIGMPLGPADFRVPEPVGLPDVVCGVLEIASVVAALLAVRSLRHPDQVSAARVRTAWAATTVASVLVLTAWAVVPTVTGGGHEHSPARSVAR